MQERKPLSKNTVNLLLLIFVCITGAVFGVIYSDSVSDDLITNICALRKYGSVCEILSEDLFKVFIVCLLLFVLGLSPVSFPIEIMLTFFIGQSVGSTFYKIYDREGLFLSLSILPSICILTVSLSLCVRESIRMSQAVYKRTFQSNEYTPADIKLYIKKFLVIIFIGFMGSVTDALSAFFLN